MTQRQTLLVIGCGTVFEKLVNSWATVFHASDDYKCTDFISVRFESTDEVMKNINEKLLHFNPSVTTVFAAVDQNAMNFARLGVYAQARMLGFKATTLIHPAAIVAADVKIGENCWIGPGAVIESAVKIGSNTFIGAKSYIDYGATISTNCWVGADSFVGHSAKIGQHVVVGSGVSLGAGISIGRNCVVDKPGIYLEPLEDGTFIDSLFSSPVRMYIGN